MRLVLRIPHSESETLPLVFSLACSAPMFRTETEDWTPAYMAIFPHLSLPFDLVERLIGAAAEHPNVQVLIDERPLENLTEFLLTSASRHIERISLLGEAIRAAARTAPPLSLPVHLFQVGGARTGSA